MSDFGFGALAVLLTWVVGLALSLAFWGALIYFGLWCLRHFGVI